MKNSSSDRSILSKLFQFDKIATLLGFTVDCITIISILFAVKLGNTIYIEFPRFISQELALSIWVIATYTYFAYLHKHWDENRVNKTYKDTFSNFVANDLIRHFRNPVLLFPLVVLLVILVGIIVVSNTLLTIVAIGAGLLFVLSPVILLALEDMSRDASIDKASKEIIENNWQYFEKRIKIELSQNQWIDIYYLRDVAELLDISVEAISYAFAKYAYENPGKIKYGSVHRYSDGENITGRENVLVNTKTLNHERYYFSS